MINEDQVEQLAVEWFKELGYEYLHGYDIAPDSANPERANYQEVLLPNKLHSALTKLNPALPIVAIEEAMSVLKKPQHASLIQNNRAFHQLLLQGVSVEVKNGDETRGEVVKLIDFEEPYNNDFLVVNQYTIKGAKGNRRPDIVVFINGLPIAVLELKNPADTNADIFKAYNQIQTYKDEIEDLFVYNEAIVISDGINARIGSLTATNERYMYWRTIKNEKDKPVLEYELETLIKGFFVHEHFLDYIRSFVLFEDDAKHIIKKIAGYHQFHAVRTAVASVVEASKNGGDKRGGVVWHTQGSGKSISMACFAGKLSRQPQMKNPTIIIVTDRNDLDGQLFGTFSGAKILLGQDPVQIDSVDDLRDTLGDKPSGGIIFTTIQKFGLKKEEERFPILTNRDNIVVIADEAHRSQYGFDAMLDKDGKFKYGYAKHLRDALPNATFIGFTGTPIEGEDKDTRAVFGDYISIYDIEDAVRDGATVPIYYESRLAKLDLDSQILKEIDAEIGELVVDEELSDREKFKSKWSNLEKLVGAKPRIAQVAKDLVEHFENRTATIEGKGIIVAMRDRKSVV